nr:protein csf1 [Quercus suber]
MAGLTSSLLGSQDAFNWVFLVDLLVCGILALFFLFYFNRLFATLLSYAIRAWTWHKYRAYVDISALQISPLGGRIFFKDIRYHGHNVTVLVHNGMITWRYWLRSVQVAEIFDVQSASGNIRQRAENVGDGEEGGVGESDEKLRDRDQSVSRAEKAGGDKKTLPCRISVKVTAVEAFIYNQSPVYDNIVQAMLRKSTQASGTDARKDDDDAAAEQTSVPSSSSGASEKMHAQFAFAPEEPHTPDTTSASQTLDTNRLPEIPAWLRIFPIRIECKRAAAAVGNENTTSVITAKVEKAAGTIDAGPSGPLDYYKLLFNFALEGVVASMKPNDDFKSYQLAAARRILRDQEIAHSVKTTVHSKVIQLFAKPWRSLIYRFHRDKGDRGSLRTASMGSVVEQSPALQEGGLPGELSWRGLTRYLDESGPGEQDEWKKVEYAKASTLVDCEKVDFKFYFDLPGIVPSDTVAASTFAAPAHCDDLNGSEAPEYGLEFGVHGGVIVYGPWADRQRVNLQHVFFPAPCTDAVPRQRLKAGETRAWTVFKIYVIVEEDVVLRIPTRETSKDDRWAGRASRNTPGSSQDGDRGKKRYGRKQKREKQQKGKQAKSQADVRPYAWIDVKIMKNTTVHYKMDMFAREDGYRNILDLDVTGTEMTSSVNHDLLWRAGSLTLQADLSNPCAWNTLRSWPFRINCDALELFILRDHMFLITDVVNDWSTGPAPEFFTFVPYHYSLDLTFRNFVMYLNVNDANIITDPANLEKNDFLTLEGKELHGVLAIPLEHFRPKRSSITFDVLAQQMGMRLLSASRSTLRTLLEDDDKHVVDLPKLTLKGSYSANAAIGTDLTDVLHMDLVGTGLNLKAHGFFIRLLINVKENYFGDYIHFKTLEEFQNAGDTLNEANAKTATIAKPQTANELDVILCIVAEDATVMFPTNLYSGERCIRAELPVANLDLRVTSYYLDMGLNISPISIVSASDAAYDDKFSDKSESSTQIYISHVDLYGLRAFGPPPVEPAYACEWDVNVGSITGECSSDFLHDATLAGQAFVFTFPDGENVLPVINPNIFYDITFAQVRTDILRIWLHIGEDALLVSAAPVSIESNDWSRGLFSQRISVLAPLITLACVDARRASRPHIAGSSKTLVHTHAFLQTGVTLSITGRKANFAEQRAKQQFSLRQNDLRTDRAPFLQHRPGYVKEFNSETNQEFVPPALQLPRLPLPIERYKLPLERSPSIDSTTSFATPKGIGRKQSTSSLSSSIRDVSAVSAAAAVRLIVEPSKKQPRLQSSYSFRSSRSQISSRTLGITPFEDHATSTRSQHDVSVATMSFASPFAEPYFPLDQVEPDELNVPTFLTSSYEDDVEPSRSSSSMPYIELDAGDDDEFEQTSILIKCEPGLRIFAEPRIADVAIKLVDVILPKTSETVMDAFQVNVMGHISSRQAASHGKSRVLEIQASLPSARIRLSVPQSATTEVAPIQPCDLMDATIRQLEQTVRVRTEPTGLEAKQTLVLHTLSEGMALSIGAESLDGKPGVPAIGVHVNDILVWLANASTSSAHVSVRETNLQISGEQAKYLTHFGLRLMPLIKGITNRINEVVQADRRRLTHLIHTLTRHGEAISDPPFLSRMIYILRAFPDHYRNQESWKILSRFRQILQSLPSPVRYDLDVACEEAETRMAEADIQTEILQSWAQWRNWDIPNVSQTLAFRTLFGDADQVSLNPSPKTVTALTIRAEYIQMIVSNNEKASKIVIEDTSIALEDSPPTAPTGLMLVDENLRTKTQLQIYTTNIAIALDWSTYEVVEIALPLFDELSQISTQYTDISTTHRGPGKVLEDGIDRHDLHIVLATESGSITIKTINLQLLARTEGLKMSLIGTTQAGDLYGRCASALLNADRAVTELYGPKEEKIWHTLLASPSLYIDQLQPRQGSQMSPTITLAAAYADLEIAVLEQVPGILHIVDLFMVDEVAKIQKLVALAAPNKDYAPMDNLELLETKQSHTITTPKFSIALLAGTLHLELSLLSTLNYHMEGTAASIRVAPSMTEARLFDLDFDVGKQQHSFVNLSGGQRHESDICALPPINGHVSVQTGSHETSVSIALTVETIEVDAGAIQRVIAVLNRSEVQNVISAIESGVEDIKEHAQELSNAPTELPLATPNKAHKILYDARLALLGVRLAASTPQLRKSTMAEVEFGIGPFHAKASNRATSDNNNPLVPQVHAQIRDIGARLMIISHGQRQQCGNVTLSLSVHFDSKMAENGTMTRELTVRSNSLEASAYPETASTVVDVINHLQDRIRELDLTKEVEYLRRLRDSRRGTVIQRIKGRKAIDAGMEPEDMTFTAADLLLVQTTIELRNIQISWLVGQSFASTPDSKPDDAVLTLSSILFTTRGGNEAKLTLQDLMLQLTQERGSITTRSLNSALLPEIGFSVAYWSKDKKWSLAFKATGQPLDLRLESSFILPVSGVERSISFAIETFKKGTATWQSTPTTAGAPRKRMLDTKRLASLLVEADFAGAQMYVQGSSKRRNTLASIAVSAQQQYENIGARHGRYGQFAAEGRLMHTTLKAPGMAHKLEYSRNIRQPTIIGEMRIDASRNMLLPNVVPLVLEITDSVKDVMKTRGDAGKVPQVDNVTTRHSTQRFFEEESIVTANPSAFFGKTKVNLGLRIRRQEFGLSCQPIARIDATAGLEDLYFTVNTIDSDDYGHFFAMSAVITKLTAQVKHMYSREPTFSYDMESIVLSLMNSKHLSGVNGVSAILKFDPTKITINGKQLQDLLLFREIWLPPEIRQSSQAAQSPPVNIARAEDYIVQRYKTVAAAAAFPWNATVSISQLAVELDLGQSIGKSSFTISNVWASQQKSSNWEQNLCIGMDEMAITSTGRMSGFIDLTELSVRTFIKWPEDVQLEKQTPLIQASVGFRRLRAKAAFDYQAFAFGDIEGLDFLMYNVRDKGSSHGTGDRLVAVLDCAKAYVFCTSTSPAQAVGLYQAFDRLIQDKQAAYMQSLRDIEKHVRRESTIVPTRFGPAIDPTISPAGTPVQKEMGKSSISLHTDVVLTLGNISFGVFPGTFFDSQILKLEANNIQARFAVGLEAGKIHSGLGMTLGQLQVALASVRRVTAVPKALDVSVDEVVNSALNSKGGIILRVPKVVASMQTWQEVRTTNVDYIFKSLFDGKIDVGWNLSRINFIKGMWISHSRSLASRLGKALPESALKISASSITSDTLPATASPSSAPQGKITAQVNLPQSRYEYRALEPPVIETPQLRDMGEATPPLEWIGLNRDRLPNVTHQIIIVSLLEMAKEVEEAYEKILGNS